MALEVNILTVDDKFTPIKSHRDDAAYDVRAAIVKEINLAPGQRAIIPLGFKLGLPVGYEAILVPRSGIAAKHGITIVNSPGTIDSGYRGELMAIVLNTDAYHSFKIEPEDRIAQMKIQPVLATVLKPVFKLNKTQRDTAGFGSTGQK